MCPMVSFIFDGEATFQLPQFQALATNLFGLKGGETSMASMPKM